MDVTLKGIMQYFGMSPSDFTREWKNLTAKDKEEIKAGLANDSLTY